MSGLLEGVLGLASPWGYVIVAALAGLEAAAFVGLVIPGETAMLLGGVLAFTGRADLVIMMICAAAGAIIGDSVGYELGRRFGDSLQHSRVGRWLGERRWERAEEYVRIRGGRAILLGRFVGVLRAMVPFVAGASQMPYRTFLPYNALGAVIWAPGFVYLGYLAGNSYQQVAQAAGRAGWFILLGLVVTGSVVLVARWVIRHPDRVLAPVRWLRERPTVARLERRYADQLEFLARRFDPAAPLGLTVTAGVVILGLLAFTFAGVTEDVVAGNELVRVDGPVSAFLIDHREPWLTGIMRVVTDFGSVMVLVPTLTVLAILAWRRYESWWPAEFLAFCLGGAAASSAVIKLVIARPRPTSAALVEALGYAFPSGHSAGAAAGWLAAALVAGSFSRSFRLRVNLMAAAILVVVLVGVSRVYLGVHTATDVMAGWALGASWVALGLLLSHLVGLRHPPRVHGSQRPPLLTPTDQNRPDALGMSNHNTT